ncbi:hypothetical protein L195_g007754 [Trifolium pratense]|uniref:Uncharacterized protein n=1 Tax=Trifolium pratense TaxID=57577 RepID=A0A2K3P785_TRIPR|nr:hypothetical protein L195_g007754 [Trifolium pratense]
MDGEESSEIEVSFNGRNEKDEFQSKEVGSRGSWAMGSAMEEAKNGSGEDMGCCSAILKQQHRSCGGESN